MKAACSRAVRIIRLGALAAVFGVSISVSAPGEAPPAGPVYPPIVQEKVAEARKSVRTVDMAGFREIIDDRGHRLIIDVREPEEFEAGHIPGAIHIPRGILEFGIWKQVGFPDHLDMHMPIYLYCGTGARCLLAAKSLQDLGFTRVTAVIMRLDDWRKAGFPLVR